MPITVQVLTVPIQRVSVYNFPFRNFATEFVTSVVKPATDYAAHSSFDLG